MNDSEPSIFGAITAQKAQVISAGRLRLPSHLPFNCIRVRVAVPDVAGVPVLSVELSNFLTFKIVLVFADPEIKVKEVEELNPDVKLPVANDPLEFL